MLAQPELWPRQTVGAWATTEHSQLAWAAGAGRRADLAGPEGGRDRAGETRRYPARKQRHTGKKRVARRVAAQYWWFLMKRPSSAAAPTHEPATYCPWAAWPFAWWARDESQTRLRAHQGAGDTPWLCTARVTTAPGTRNNTLFCKDAM